MYFQAHVHVRRPRGDRPMRPSDRGRLETDERRLPSQVRLPKAVRREGRHQPERVPRALPEGEDPVRLGREQGRAERGKHLLVREEGGLIRTLLQPHHDAAKHQDAGQW
jgi:hypothetical protein